MAKDDTPLFDARWHCTHDEAGWLHDKQGKIFRTDAVGSTILIETTDGNSVCMNVLKQWIPMVMKNCSDIEMRHSTHQAEVEKE